MTILLISSNEKDIFKAHMYACYRNIHLINAKNLDESHSLLIQKKFEMIIIDKNLSGRGTFPIREHAHSYGFTHPVLVYNEEDKENLEALWIAQNQNSPFEKIIREISKAFSKEADIANTLQHKKNCFLRPQTRTLLELFFSNIGIPVTIETISENLWGIPDSSRKETIYTYVCELRKFLHINGGNRNLIKIHDGKYILENYTFFETKAECIRG